jgi:hypothetical protein
MGCGNYEETLHFSEGHQYRQQVRQWNRLGVNRSRRRRSRLHDHTRGPDEPRHGASVTRPPYDDNTTGWAPGRRYDGSDDSLLSVASGVPWHRHGASGHTHGFRHAPDTRAQLGRRVRRRGRHTLMSAHAATPSPEPSTPHRRPKTRLHPPEDAPPPPDSGRRVSVGGYS